MGASKHLSRLFDGVFPKSRLCLMDQLRERLKSSPVTVIDIGGAMGPDACFEPLRPDMIKFMMFEPDGRSQTGVEASVVGDDLVFPIGLARQAGKRKLYLTAGPFASSLYEPNLAFLNDFNVAPWYRPVGEEEITVDTLDDVMARTPDWQADFVKIDVEGADLEILNSGHSALDTAYGVQIEVSFSERNLGAPFFAEADIMLRESGFSLFDLEREKWVRANACHKATTQSQTIWADAVYLRPSDWLFARLKEQEVHVAHTSFSKALAILLAYQAHDKALHLVEQARDLAILDASFLISCERSVKKSLIGLTEYVVRGSAAMIMALITALPLMVFGWRGRSLAGTIIRSQAVPLFSALSKGARRTGLDRGCISDATF